MGTEEEPPSPSAEGRIIREVRERIRPRLSIAAAAAAARISEKQWGDVERGYTRRSGALTYTRVSARADTLAKMAAVVPLTPAELQEMISARKDAAKQLRGVADAADSEAADELIEAFIGSVAQPHREVLEWRWREIDAEGNLKPRRERIAALNDWVTNHMGQAQDSRSDAV